MCSTGRQTVTFKDGRRLVELLLESVLISMLPRGCKNSFSSTGFQMTIFACRAFSVATLRVRRCPQD